MEVKRTNTQKNKYNTVSDKFISINGLFKNKKNKYTCVKNVKKFICT